MERCSAVVVVSPSQDNLKLSKIEALINFNLFLSQQNWPDKQYLGPEKY
jgi:hypothetical protein